MRIYGAFIFNDELDILECRLREMDESPVYRHILVEAPVDHHGRPKPLHYAENRERFAPWADRIIHITASHLRGRIPWERLASQREFITSVLDDPDDVLFLTDADEIPRLDAFKYIVDPHPRGTIIPMRNYVFAVNWQYPVTHRSPIAIRVSNLGSVEALRSHSIDGPSAPSFSGWHFTWLGGPEAISKKITTHCHSELDAKIGNFYQQRTWMDTKLIHVDVDETFPRWIRERKCPQEWFRPL